MLRLRAVDEEAHAGAVGRLASGREVDGLLGGVAILGGAVREEAVLLVGPQREIDRSETLVASRLHHRAPAALERFFDEARQHLLQRLLLQVIEENLGCLARSSQPSRRAAPPVHCSVESLNARAARQAQIGLAPMPCGTYL